MLAIEVRIAAEILVGGGNLGEQVIAAAVHRIASAHDWNARVDEIRRIPEAFGARQRVTVYAAIAEEVYRPNLAPQFAYVRWRDEYQLEPFQAAYDRAFQLTEGFTRVAPAQLSAAILEAPEVVRVLRAIVGYQPGELAAAATLVADELGLGPIGVGRIRTAEAGRRPPDPVARTVGETVHRLMEGTLWEVATAEVRTKIDKPDTHEGWSTVQRLAAGGVPYAMFLHQRHYGGAFRTLLDATGAERGEALLERPLVQLLNGIPHIQTGAHNQREIEDRFGLTVRPAPDFVVFEGQTLVAIVECKQANDGGTARDKAGRFTTLRRESERLGGVPLFAVLDGLGWRRSRDALGPVIRETDGRVFTLATLADILTVHPFPRLAAGR